MLGIVKHFFQICRQYISNNNNGLRNHVNRYFYFLFFNQYNLLLLWQYLITHRRASTD